MLPGVVGEGGGRGWRSNERTRVIGRKKDVFLFLLLFLLSSSSSSFIDLHEKCESV